MLISKEWLDKMKKTRHDFYKFYVLTWLLLSSQTTTTCQTRQHWNYIYGGLWPFVAWVLYARWWGLKYIPIIIKRLIIWKYICTNLFLNRLWHNWEQPIILKLCLALFFSLCRVVEGRVLQPNNFSSFWAILASGVFSFLWKGTQKKNLKGNRGEIPQPTKQQHVTFGLLGWMILDWWPSRMPCKSLQWTCV